MLQQFLSCFRTFPEKEKKKKKKTKRNSLKKTRDSGSKRTYHEHIPLYNRCMVLYCDIIKNKIKSNAIRLQARKAKGVLFGS